MLALPLAGDQNRFQMLSAFRDFLRLETASGIVLVAAAVVAMIVANSPLSGFYASLIDIPVEIRIGVFEIAKPLPDVGLRRLGQF